MRQTRNGLSDSASYRKRIVPDVLFSIVHYDKLTSTNTIKDDANRREK